MSEASVKLCANCGRAVPEAFASADHSACKCTPLARARAFSEMHAEALAVEHHFDEDGTVSCAGAPFVTEQEATGLHFYSRTSGPTLKGIPNVSVLLMPDGACGIVTEKNVTPAMKSAIECAALESGEVADEWDDAAMLRLHIAVVSWLRRQWTIGRVRRAADGTWDLLPAVSAARDAR